MTIGKTELTVKDYLAKKDKLSSELAACVEEKIREFESDTGVSVISVSPDIHKMMIIGRKLPELCVGQIDIRTDLDE